MFNLNLIPGQVLQAARLIRQAGGQANLIGGSVIDLIQGREPKDWDIEVFHLSFDRLASVFAAYAPKLTGKAFGVLKVVIGGVDLDISIPRRDNKTGVGHKGFTVDVDPSMTIAEAARRRDFTINSMAVNLLTGELYDPYNGLKDLQDGVLRATDPKLFVEDPLRALRAMQLLARKAKTVDPATLRLIRSIKHTHPELPKERIWEEWRKLFMKAKRPSVGLEFLRESEWIEHYPELQALVGLEQHPEWHPEGDVWTHSKMAADAFAEIRDKVPEDMREPLGFGVFLHDLGKASTTVLPRHVAEGRAPKERLYTAWGHDKAGRTPALDFLKRLGASDRTQTLSAAIVEEHMQPWNLHQGVAEKSAYLRLAKRMQGAGGDLATLGYMSHCDACATGKPHTKHDTWASAASQRMFDMDEELRKAPGLIQPRIQGRHLIAAGFKPGNAFAPALKAAFDAQMDNPGLTDDQLLGIAVSHLTARKNPQQSYSGRRTLGASPEFVQRVSAALLRTGRFSGELTQPTGTKVAIHVQTQRKLGGRVSAAVFDLLARQLIVVYIPWTKPSASQIAELRSVVAHELTHILDPSSRAREQRQMQVARETGEAAVTHTYYNLPSEVVAYRHEVVFELERAKKRNKLTVRTAAELQAVLRRYSPTWRMIEKHLTATSKRRVLEAAAQVFS